MTYRIELGDGLIAEYLGPVKRPDIPDLTEREMVRFLEERPMEVIINNRTLAHQLRTEGVDVYGWDLESTLTTDEAAFSVSRKRLADAWENESCHGLNAAMQLCEDIDAITQQAMDGEISLAESIINRWDRISPNVDEIDYVAARMIDRLTPGAKKTVDAVHAQNIPSYVMTSGFAEFAVPVAEHLRIDRSMVIANRMKFKNGRYNGIDLSKSPTMDGKAGPCQELIDRHGIPRTRFALVDDGDNGLEAYERGVAPVIGFGGVRRSDALRSRFPVYVQAQLLEGVTFTGSLLPVLAVTSPAHAPLLQKVA